MEWMDEGLLLSAQPHGEHAMIASFLTAEHGRHAGLVAGGQSRKNMPLLQTGNLSTVRWQARLLDHLGHYTLEPLTPFAARWLADSEILAFIASACAVAEASLPERQPMRGVFASLCSLFSLEDRDLWAPAYIKWETGLLKALGYGMDLSSCALSGATEGLAYISPRTGRAATAEAGQPYAEKLLPLPAFLCGSFDWDDLDIFNGLALTGHFLSRHVFAHPQNRRLVPQDGMLPLARQRLSALYETKIQKNEEVA